MKLTTLAIFFRTKLKVVFGVVALIIIVGIVLGVTSTRQSNTMPAAKTTPASFPVGSTVDENIPAYTGKIVAGSIVYDKNYGTYNFTIIPSSPSKPYGHWTMTSIAACKPS